MREENWGGGNDTHKHDEEKIIKVHGFANADSSFMHPSDTSLPPMTLTNKLCIKVTKQSLVDKSVILLL